MAANYKVFKSTRSEWWIDAETNYTLIRLGALLVWQAQEQIIMNLKKKKVGFHSVNALNTLANRI